MQLRSPAFDHEAYIPVQHTADGPDLSPPLAWTGAPRGTASFALIVDDPDAPGGRWVHWLLWNIPATAHALPQNVVRARNLPDGSKQGLNGYGRLGWGGPAPPPGPPHRYVFTLHALDVQLPLAGGADRTALERALEGHVLASAELVAGYGRGARHR